MANYNTSSGFSDLNGTMTVTNDNVDSYNSTTLGAATVRNLGGSGLSFNLSFTSPPRTFHVNANLSGTGFSGTANNNSPAADQEPWTATSSTGEAEAKKASY